MNAKQIEKIVKAVVKGTSTEKAKKDPLSFWEKKFGFKVEQKNLKHKCSNGKTYPAVKGVTKDGTKLTLVLTRDGNVYQKPF